MELSLSAVTELLDHNYWAGDRQLSACEALTEEDFLRPLGNSFASLRDTLAHLLVVEWLWLERWKGNSPQSLPWSLDFPNLAAVTDCWRGIECEMRQYIAGLTEADLEHVVTCTSTRGQTWTYPLWRMILHFTHHQSYHRGQVTALLRQLGKQPPKVDFIDWLAR